YSQPLTEPPPEGAVASAGTSPEWLSAPRPPFGAEILGGVIGSSPGALIPDVLYQRRSVVVDEANPRRQPRHLDILHPRHFFPVGQDVSPRGQRQQKGLASVDTRRVRHEESLVVVPFQFHYVRIVEGSKKVPAAPHLKQGPPGLQVMPEMDVELEVVLQ